MDEAFLSRVREQTRTAFTELLAAARLRRDSIVVIGCSSSEIVGQRIGTCSSADCAEAVYSALSPIAQENGLYLAFQCCEHLNRALILEKDAARKYGYPMVNVVPQPKAGGSFATAAYKNFKHPVAVEHIKAAAGIDIGDTLIGMHLQDVAVPTRIETKQIGNAHVVCARTRLKFIGGERAVYDHDLM